MKNNRSNEEEEMSLPETISLLVVFVIVIVGMFCSFFYDDPTGSAIRYGVIIVAGVLGGALSAIFDKKT